MKHNLILLNDLNLTDCFLFAEVMEDPKVHQDALSIIFGHPVFQALRAGGLRPAMY